jgi:hypothetical protein
MATPKRLTRNTVAPPLRGRRTRASARAGRGVRRGQAHGSRNRRAAATTYSGSKVGAPRPAYPPPRSRDSALRRRRGRRGRRAARGRPCRPGPRTEGACRGRRGPWGQAPRSASSRARAPPWAPRPATGGSLPRRTRRQGCKDPPVSDPVQPRAPEARPRRRTASACVSERAAAAPRMLARGG